MDHKRSQSVRRHDRSATRFALALVDLGGRHRLAQVARLDDRRPAIAILPASLDQNLVGLADEPSWGWPSHAEESSTRPRRRRASHAKRPLPQTWPRRLCGANALALVQAARSERGPARRLATEALQLALGTDDLSTQGDVPSWFRWANLTPLGTPGTAEIRAQIRAQDRGVEATRLGTVVRRQDIRSWRALESLARGRRTIFALRGLVGDTGVGPPL